jgi:hypothetical protein
VKILYLLTRELDATGASLREAHAVEHAVEVIDLRVECEWGGVVAAIAAADRVVCW